MFAGQNTSILMEEVSSMRADDVGHLQGCRFISVLVPC